MFRTSAQAAVSVPDGTLEPGSSIFNHVEVLFHYFWFVGLYLDERGDHPVYRTALARGIEELKSLGDAWGCNLVQVHVAVPRGRTQHGEFDFELLVAAWECEDPRYPGEPANVFCSITGSEYTDVIPEIETSRLRRLRRFYPLPSRAPHPTRAA